MTAHTPQTVTWWLSVSHDNTWGSELYVREVEMAHLPGEGDSVYVMASEEEPGEGAVELAVLKRHWDVEGRAHLHFPQIVVDPEDQLANHLPRGYTSWWTDRDGPDPEQLLRLTGWRRYGEDPDADA